MEPTSRLETPSTGTQAIRSRRPRSFKTALEEQLEEMLLNGFDGEVVDVRLLPSAPTTGRPNPKVFVIVKEVDFALYERITRVTLQLADLLDGVQLNFDIIPEQALPMVHFEALAVRR